MQRALEGTQDGIWDWNIPSGNIYFSPRWCSMLGYTQAELRPHLSTWSTLVHPDDIEAARREIRRFIDGEFEFYETEYRMRTKSGEWRWILDRGKIIERDADGSPVRAVGAHTDVTRQKQTEERLADLMRLAPVGIYEVDAAGKCRYANRRWCEISGIPEDTAAGTDWSAAVHPEDRERVAREHQHALAHDYPMSSVHRYLRPDGGIRWVRSNTTKLLDTAGTLKGFFAAVEDISDLKAAERDLLKKNEELDASARRAEAAALAKSRFLASMSHEIRTPLNGVLGIAEQLATTPLTDEQRQSVDTLVACGRTLLAVVNDSLDLSRIEAGRMELKTKAFRPKEWFSQILAMFRPLADAKGIELQSRVEGDTEIVLEGDAGKLRQVVVNLVGNAIKFTERGHVLVTLDLRHGLDQLYRMRCEVEDSGPGVEAIDLERVFEPFERGSSTREESGTGLGLSIAKNLVELMSGTIGVGERPLKRKGACFWFQVALPAVSAQTLPAIAPRTEALDGPCRVLVADDHPVNRKLMTLLLKRLGASFRVVSDGCEALQALESENFDCALLDIEMPGLTGFEVAGRAHTLPHVPKLVALTAHAAPGTEQLCLENGMDAYLSKPVSLDALARTLRNVQRQSATPRAAITLPSKSAGPRPGRSFPGN